MLSDQPSGQPPLWAGTLTPASGMPSQHATRPNALRGRGQLQRARQRSVRMREERVERPGKAPPAGDVSGTWHMEPGESWGAAVLLICDLAMWFHKQKKGVWHVWCVWRALVGAWSVDL